MATRLTTGVGRAGRHRELQPFEKEYVRKDGSRVPVLVGAAVFEGRQDEGVAFVLDLTERKRAEAEREKRERLRQAQKMELIGTLAGASRTTSTTSSARSSATASSPRARRASPARCASSWTR